MTTTTRAVATISMAGSGIDLGWENVNGNWGRVAEMKRDKGEGEWKNEALSN